MNFQMLFGRELQTCETKMLIQDELPSIPCHGRPSREKGGRRGVAKSGMHCIPVATCPAPSPSPSFLSVLSMFWGFLATFSS